MIKEKFFRGGLIILPAFLLIACSISGSVAPDGGTQETPTGAAVGGGAGGKNNAGGGGAGGSGGKLSSTMESVPYSIYVRAVVSGKCGAYTNSAGFKDMEFEASFEGMVFMRPMGKGIPGPLGGLHRKTQPAAFAIAGGMYLDGRGEIQRIEYCPQYETEEVSYPVHIISGPNPFEAWISIMSPTATDAGAGVVPTKTPVGGGEAWIMFHIGNGLSGGPILEYEIEGDKGEEDESSMGNPVRFVSTWDQLMKGEDFTVRMENGDEGEIWSWEIRLIPEPVPSN
jgi:hypothetical protein